VNTIWNWSKSTKGNMAGPSASGCQSRLPRTAASDAKRVTPVAVGVSRVLSWPHDRSAAGIEHPRNLQRGAAMDEISARLDAALIEHSRLVDRIVDADLVDDCPSEWSAQETMLQDVLEAIIQFPGHSLRAIEWKAVCHQRAADVIDPRDPRLLRLATRVAADLSSRSHSGACSCASGDAVPPTREGNRPTDLPVWSTSGLTGLFGRRSHADR
jgi:hypothetical protein